MADGVGFEPTEGFHLRRFSRPVLSTAQSPIRLVDLLCTLGFSLWQVIYKLFNYAIIVYIVYIFYMLYEKVATEVATVFNQEIKWLRDSNHILITIIIIYLTLHKLKDICNGFFSIYIR